MEDTITATELSLNQAILVESSAYFGSQIIELDLTKVHDVKNGRVIMTKNHNWGACPSRDRSKVISNAEEAGIYFDMKFGKYLAFMKEHNLNVDNNLYYVFYCDSRSSVMVYNYVKVRSVDSLRDGKYDEYEPRGSQSDWCYYTNGFRFRDGDTLPFHNTIADIREAFIETIMRVI